MLLGLGDIWVAAAFYLMFLSTILCVVYGAMNWNRGEADALELAEESEWAKEEHDIEETL